MGSRLLIDSLLGTPLGEHGFVFAIICYIAGYLRTHFMARPLALQIDKIFLLICLGQIFILWFHVLAGQNPSTLLYWVGSIMSCMLWPVFVILLHKLSECMNIAPYSSRSI